MSHDPYTGTICIIAENHIKPILSLPGDTFDEVCSKEAGWVSIGQSRADDDWTFGAGFSFLQAEVEFKYILSIMPPEDVCSI